MDEVCAIRTCVRERQAWAESQATRLQIHLPSNKSTSIPAVQMKTILALLLIICISSCRVFNPENTKVRTVVIEERIDRHGNYYVVCSDGMDRYELRDVKEQVPLLTSVTIHKYSHLYEIHWNKVALTFSK